MSGRTLVLVALVVTWLATVAVAQSPGGAPIPPAVGAAQDYVGSAACRACHESAFTAWQRSIHAQMTKPIGEASVSGEFQRDAPVTQHGRTYTMGRSGGRYEISVAQPGSGGAETFTADFTLGAKRFQGYLSRLPDGRIYVLPVFWNVEWRRWLDWRELTPVPDSPHDLRQIWNVNCFNCHATNIQRNFDSARRTFATTATEFGVGCEACHGPGRAHVEVTQRLSETAGAPKPGGALQIFSTHFATTRQVNDSCAYCHGNKTNYFTGFTPGASLEDFAQLGLMSDPVPAGDTQGDFWQDGRPSRFNRPQALTLAGCFQAGALRCTNCHAAHGSANEHSLKVSMAESDRLCTQCHEPLQDGAAAARHSHHAAESAGSRCVACHMSDVNWRLLNRRRDHTFAAPVPELTARFGVPNGCTTCHEDRAPEWAAETMDRWYADAPRRRRALTVAETMDDAAGGDRAAAERLAAIAVDARAGALLRASAAGFIGRFASPTSPLSPAVIRALIDASADPEPMVRIAAIRALGNADAERAIPALAARLVDSSRVARIGAAEGLLYFGVTSGLGGALSLALEEYEASLREFPDMASNQASLGWLLAARGSTDAALEALRLARSLDGSDARPRVYLGVLAARGGRYQEAIDEWEAARRLNPAFPNIDRLIAEAYGRLTSVKSR